MPVIDIVVIAFVSILVISLIYKKIKDRKEAKKKGLPGCAGCSHAATCSAICTNNLASQNKEMNSSKNQKSKEDK